jgi:hypothetical protein
MKDPDTDPRFEGKTRVDSPSGDHMQGSYRHSREKLSSDTHGGAA